MTTDFETLDGQPADPLGAFDERDPDAPTRLTGLRLSVEGKARHRAEWLAYGGEPEAIDAVLALPLPPTHEHFIERLNVLRGAGADWRGAVKGMEASHGR